MKSSRVSRWIGVLAVIAVFFFPLVVWASEDDIDNDGVINPLDNCVSTPNGPVLGTCLGGINDGGICTGYLDCGKGVCVKSQADKDGDGLGDVCDNCIPKPNGPDLGTCIGGSNLGRSCLNPEECAGGLCSMDQEDGDGEGDDCDCNDGYMGPGEEGADCGGRCLASCPDTCIPLVRNGSSLYRIDVFLIPSTEYGNLADFREDAMAVIQNSYFNDPILGSSRAAFNFWYTPLPETVAVESNGRCNWSMFAEFDLKNRCPGADIGAILHIANCQDYSLGDVFSSENISFGTFLHESGHGVFGLADEYDGAPACSTHYFQPYPLPNIFDARDSCESGGDSCHEFTTCGSGLWWDGWWKDVNQVDTIMECGCSAYPRGLCPWGDAAEPQVRYYLDYILGHIFGIGGSDADSSNKVIVCQMQYDGTDIQLLSSTVMVGDAPDRYLVWDGLEFVFYDHQDVETNAFSIRDPRYRDYDFPPDGEMLDQVVFTVVFPYTDQLSKFTVLDAPSQLPLRTFDLLPVVADFCLEHPIDDQCIVFDGDGDGLPDEWEQAIVDDDPADGITTVAHVLPFDDYDGEGFTNWREFLGNSSAVDAASVPAPMEILVDGTNTTGAENGTTAHPFDTIQEGIDLAGPGDTVRIADGTYTGPGNIDLDFRGKAIVLASVNGAAAVTIDAQYLGRGFTFHSGETAASIVDGFTITNGSASSGGGMMVSNGSAPTIRNCVFLNNASTSSAGGGGGIGTATGSSPTLKNCVLENNTAVNAGGGMSNGADCNPAIHACTFTANSATWGGGAMYNHLCSPTVSNSIFSRNISAHWGGAVHNNYDAADPVFSDCRFTANAAQQGGAVFNRNGADPQFVGCTFSKNDADPVGQGGAIFNRDNGTNPVIIACSFSENTASDDGGGIYSNSGCSLQIVNCRFTGNRSTDKAGALYCRSGDLSTVINSTFFANQAAYGGGIYIWGASDTTVANAVFWGNSAPYGPQIGLGEGSSLVIGYSDLEGGQAVGVFTESSTVNWDAASMIALDPLFAGAAGPDNVVGTEDDDLHLSPGSPCIDAGDNAAMTAGISVDLDGAPRFFDDPETIDTGTGIAPIIDMGAYEYVSTCLEDFDLDGDVDGTDLSLFVNFLNVGDLRADLTVDGVVDDRDVGIFAAALGRNDCR